MAKKKSPKRPSVKRDPAVRERIIAVALEHPYFGTRRLSRLLKTEGTVVSESTIRSTLLKQGLQTCKLRQQLIRTNLIGSHSAPSASPLPQSGGEGKGPEREPEAPILVALPAAPEEAVKNPVREHGASSMEKASYLRGLIAKPSWPFIPARESGAFWLFHAKPEPESAIPVITSAQALVDGAIKVPVPPPQARPEARPEALPQRRSEWRAVRERWIVRAAKAALICVAIYACGGTALKIRDIFHVGLDQSVASAVPISPEARYAQGTASRTSPMEAYRVIWERNLFKISEPPKKADLNENIDVGKIAVAEKDLGLKLIGTVLASDHKLNHAVIHVALTRTQGVFREGEHVGGVLIKGISRNNVIIETEKGQVKRLTVEDTDLRNLGAVQASVKVPPKPSAYSTTPQQNEGGLISVQIPLSEVRTSLSNIQLAMAASSLSPHGGDGKSDGFYAVGPGPQNILPRLGLLPGGLIMGMDGVHLQDPGDTEALFEKLADGGDFSILVQRGDRTQNLHLTVQ